MDAMRKEMRMRMDNKRFNRRIAELLTDIEKIKFILKEEQDAQEKMLNEYYQSLKK